jgi:hypothetical protein
MKSRVVSLGRETVRPSTRALMRAAQDEEIFLMPSPMPLILSRDPKGRESKDAAPVCSAQPLSIFSSLITTRRFWAWLPGMGLPAASRLGAFGNVSA